MAHMVDQMIYSITVRNNLTKESVSWGYIHKSLHDRYQSLIHDPIDLKTRILSTFVQGEYPKELELLFERWLMDPAIWIHTEVVWSRSDMTCVWTDKIAVDCIDCM